MPLFRIITAWGQGREHSSGNTFCGRVQPSDLQQNAVGAKCGSRGVECFKSSAFHPNTLRHYLLVTSGVLRVRVVTYLIYDTKKRRIFAVNGINCDHF